MRQIFLKISITFLGLVFVSQATTCFAATATTTSSLPNSSTYWLEGMVNSASLLLSISAGSRAEKSISILDQRSNELVSVLNYASGNTATVTNTITPDQAYQTYINSLNKSTSLISQVGTPAVQSSLQTMLGTSIVTSVAAVAPLASSYPSYTSGMYSTAGATIAAMPTQVQTQVISNASTTLSSLTTSSTPYINNFCQQLPTSTQSLITSGSTGCSAPTIGTTTPPATTGTTTPPTGGTTAPTLTLVPITTMTMEQIKAAVNKTYTTTSDTYAIKQTIVINNPGYVRCGIIDIATQAAGISVFGNTKDGLVKIVDWDPEGENTPAKPAQITDDQWSKLVNFTPLANGDEVTIQNK